MHEARKEIDGLLAVTPNDVRFTAMRLAAAALDSDGRDAEPLARAWLATPTAVAQPGPVYVRIVTILALTRRYQAAFLFRQEALEAAGPPYTSVYLYMLHGEMLELEAFVGRVTDHTRISVGQGVCGTAIATGEDQNVGDVRAVGNYLACNLDTRSELVVLIKRGTTILGQIDVDSDVQNPFTPAEHEATKKVADALAVLL